MSSRIEQIIEEIEEYIDSCKFQPLSTTKIIVNKDQMDELLRELRMKTPDEIKRYQKIIANKDAILADAQAKADSMIEEAQIQTNELVSEHEIMQQAYAQANEVVTAATEQAQEILDNATRDANERCSTPTIFWQMQRASSDIPWTATPPNMTDWSTPCRSVTTWSATTGLSWRSRSSRPRDLRQSMEILRLRRKNPLIWTRRSKF